VTAGVCPMCSGLPLAGGNEKFHELSYLTS